MLADVFWCGADQHKSAMLQPEDLLAASPAKPSAKPSEAQQTKGESSKATLTDAQAGAEHQLSAGESKGGTGVAAMAAPEDSTSDCGNGKLSSDGSGSSSSSESGETGHDADTKSW